MESIDKIKRLAEIVSKNTAPSSNTNTLIGNLLKAMALYMAEQHHGAVGGYQFLNSIDDLPTGDLTDKQKRTGYVVGENIYFYVGTGGDTLDGEYQNGGSFHGTKGDDGLSAYEIWKEIPGNENNTLNDFWAFLTADKGYTKQAVTYEEFNTLTPENVDTNVIYVYPNSTNTEYYAKVSNGNTWVLLLRNNGDITNLSDRIGQIEDNIGSVITEGIVFEIERGLVSSETGEIGAEKGKTIETSDYRNTSINLEGKDYKKIKFQEHLFTDSWGYGFVLSNGTWVGTKGSSGDIIGVPIPDDAVTFKTCWWRTVKQNIEVVRSSLVTDRLSKRIDENDKLIGSLRDNVADLYAKMGTESFENIQYTEIQGSLVSSDNGALIDMEGYYSVEIPLENTFYTKIKFKIWHFTNPRGYGFLFSDGHWEGVHTTQAMYNEVKEVLVNIPENAVMFKTCWTAANWFTQDIQGCVEQSVFVGLQRQINDNASSIGEVNTSLSELSKKLGSDVWQEVEFTPEVGLIDSEHGTVNTAAPTYEQYRYAIIDLAGTTYKKISFLPRAFTGYYGYGFILSDGVTWKGTRGTITSNKEPIPVEIPDGAVTFKTCWYNTQPQVIRALATQDNYTNLQEQVTDLRDEIENNSNVSYIIKPFTISVSDCRDIIPNLTVSRVYELWDSLISQYPDYLSNTELGYEQSNTYKMRKIEFGIKDNNSNGNDLILKKIMVTANIHGWLGDSHIPAYMMYWLTKFILDNKATNELAQWILGNFYFVIIPIANPWGFENKTRGNSRNIDLNRNFDADFVPNADPYNTGITSGTTAASEAETQIIQSVIDANQDLWMFVDFHSQPATQPLVSMAPRAGRMQYLPNSADTVLRKQCEKALYYGKLVANDWIENIATSTGGQSMRYAYKHLNLKRVITLEAAGHPDEKIDNGTTWDYFNTKAMTGVARLFLSLLRFE